MGKFMKILAEQGLKANQGKELINGKHLKGDTSNIWGDAKNIKGNVNRYLRGDVSNISGDIIGLKIEGDVSNITGNVSKIWGDVSNLKGNVSKLKGDVTGLKGDATGLTIEELKAKQS